MKNKNKPVKPAKDKPTLVCFLLDRSASMGGCRDETISGFNAYIQKMRDEMPDAARFSMMQFDSMGFEMMHDKVKLADVKDLSLETYKPRANTPLYDAMGLFIHNNRSPKYSGYKVVFVSLTDGQENASSEWTLERIQALIKEMEDVHKWTFAHIGVGVQGWGAGATMYSGTRSSANVAKSSYKGTKDMYASLAANTVRHAHSGATGQCVSSSFWGSANPDLDDPKNKIKKI